MQFQKLISIIYYRCLFSDNMLCSKIEMLCNDKKVYLFNEVVGSVSWKSWASKHKSETLFV